MRTVFLILKKTFIVLAVLAFSLSTWSSVTAEMKSNAVSAMTVADTIPDNIDMNASELNKTAALEAASGRESVSTFSDLKAAIGRVPTDGTLYTIEITASFSFSGVLLIDGNKNIAIFGNGNAFMYTGGRHFNVSGNASTGTNPQLTLENMTLNGGNVNGGVRVSFGSLTLDGVTIQNCKSSSYGGGAEINNSASVTMKSGSVIQGCSATSGGSGVYLITSNSTSSLTMESGAVIQNCTGNSGVRMSGGFFVMKDGAIIQNCSGGLYASSNANITMEDGAAIQNCNGTGVMMQGSSSTQVTMKSGSVIRNCKTSSYGGGVYIQYGSMTMEDGAVIEGCTADQRGGALYTNSGGTFTMEGGAIIQNCSAPEGGGAYLHSATNGLIMESGSVIQGCTASGKGGAVFLLRNKLTMNGDAAIRNCTAGTDGGGVYIGYDSSGNGSLTMNGGIFSGNKAPNGNGGGIFTGSNYSSTYIKTSESSQFRGNSAKAAYNYTGTGYTNIKFASVSIQGTHVLNNYDINYTSGNRINVYTVNYNANGAAGTPPGDGTFPSGATVTVAGQNTLFKEGYAFDGWMDVSGTVYTPGDTFKIIGDVTLYAQWSAAEIPVSPAYTVIYSANGAAGTPPADETFPSGATVTVAGQNTLVKDGHTFAGWMDDSGTSYIPEDTFTITGDVILYAQWSATEIPVSPAYTVIYNANGASGTPPADETFPSGATVTVAGQNTLVKDGHTFDGWMDDFGTSYIHGDTFTITSDVTLYAQWSVIRGSDISNRTTGESRRLASYGYDETIEIEENEVPLANTDIAGIVENKIPLTGAYSKFSFIRLAYLLVLSGLIFRSVRRDRYTKHH